MKHARSITVRGPAGDRSAAIVVVRSANKSLFAERKATTWRAAGLRGFTLTELLVVISIIAIIASFALVALSAARHQARITKTKALIGKLDNVIRDMYASYRDRRVPIGMTTSGGYPMPPRSAGYYRLLAIRDLMRMEMPERWADITTNPIAYDPSDGGRIARPALSRAYLRRLQQSAPSSEYASAECLYLIVTMGTAEGRSQFADHDIGDADNDGYPEFHDAWGNPIKFLRWAPGFLADSDIQTGNAVEDHDPLDPTKYDTVAYRLVPLIYSAGPDGIYDINVEGGNYFYTPGAIAINPYAENVGEPIDSENMSVTTGEVPANGRLDHYDNIHNHRSEAE